MYVTPNFQTKKALKESVAKGTSVFLYQPGPFGGNEPSEGTHSVEGPWYPQPHRWYATVIVKDGVVVSVK